MIQGQQRFLSAIPVVMDIKLHRASCRICVQAVDLSVKHAFMQDMS